MSGGGSRVRAGVRRWITDRAYEEIQRAQDKLGCSQKDADSSGCECFHSNEPSPTATSELLMITPTFKNHLLKHNLIMIYIIKGGCKHRVQTRAHFCIHTSLCCFTEKLWSRSVSVFLV